MQQTANGDQTSKNDPRQISKGSHLAEPDPYAFCPHVYILETYKLPQSCAVPETQIIMPAFFVLRNATLATKSVFEGKYGAILNPGSSVIRLSWGQTDIDLFTEEEKAAGSRSIWSYSEQDGAKVMVTVKQIPVALSLKEK
jgi:hypothetical protein